MSKLRLTTCEPFSVVLEAVCNAPTPHTSIVDEIGVFQNKAGKWSGYIHGQAERLAGFDIPRFISGTLPDEEGEIPCVLVLPSGEHECRLVQWRDKEGRMWRYRALICLVDDRAGLEYARKCAQRKATSL